MSYPLERESVERFEEKFSNLIRREPSFPEGDLIDFLSEELEKAYQEGIREVRLRSRLSLDKISDSLRDAYENL